MKRFLCPQHTSHLKVEGKSVLLSTEKCSICRYKNRPAYLRTTTNDYDSKDIYLKSPKGEIVGLHAIGVKGPYSFTLVDIDDTESTITTDFNEFEKWGNNYDENYKMLGRGSFRVFDLTIDHTAKCYEDEGWVRFERAK